MHAGDPEEGKLLLDDGTQVRQQGGRGGGVGAQSAIYSKAESRASPPVHGIDTLPHPSPHASPNHRF